MPEYVYALHDFLPEHEDEVSFHAGERIEVIEKDDLYNDGWWQGRNLTGKTGLFPQSYTTPAPPSTDAPEPTTSTSSVTPDTSATETGVKSVLQPLHEESETESPLNSTTNIISPVPKTPAILHNEDDNTDSEDHIRERVISTSDGEVMKATMTDVQKAIEQLGRHNHGEDGDGSRSFSFASSRDHTEGETDTDFDMSDVDGVGADDGGEGWHKGARRKLAAKARRAVEEAEKLEAMMGGLGMSSTDRRAVAPPIEVELSDESEGEDGDYTMHSSIYPREHPHIPEEDEDAETDLERLTPGQHTKEVSSEHGTAKRGSTGSTHVVVPDRDESEQQTATATRSSFPAFHLPPAFPYAEVSAVQTPDEVKSSKHSSHSVVVPPITTSSPPPTVEPTATTINFPEPKRNSTPLRESMIALPSPTGSFPGFNTGGFTANGHSKHSSVTSASSTRGPALSISQPLLTASSMQDTLIEEKKEKGKEKGHPTEWSVEDVIDWLKTRGFDQDVCDKFIEQEITGDVLLELDVNLLKTEIGIMAFGKRVRIANAITDLRRPPSIVYSDHPEQLSPSSPMMQTHSPLSPQSQTQSQTHSRNQSQSHSQHSYTGNGYTYPQSVQSSVGSPLVYGNGNGISNGIAYTTSQATEVQDYNGHAIPRLEMEGVIGEQSPGLPIGAAPPVLNGKGQKARPAQLALSPSDGALKSSALAVSDIPEEGEEERGHVSDGEIRPTTSMRRRLFGRSQESAGSKVDSAANSRHSREGSLSQSPTVLDIPEKSKAREKDRDKDSASTGSRHTRSKKSIDGGKGGERLSIFGGSFGGGLGKTRKPAPRTNEDTISEKPSMFTLPRLHSSSIRKSSSTASYRPSTPHSPDVNGIKERKKDPKPAPITVAKEIKEKEGRDPALLRKRTSSAPNMPSSDLTKSANTIMSPLKPGQSILEQIGDHDHNGWMRKKGDRYNSWKLRYFVLKGPDLYCLKSSSKTETKIKGYINIVGYKVTVDENVNPGRYGFRIEHDHDKTHYFSSDEKTIIRDWMKAIMKATIGRDYTKPVISSCNIPTIPLTVAQAMNPAPRPPSPTARDATQKALRRENPNQLSSRDARILMGLPSNADGKEERTRLDSFFSNEAVGADNDQTSAGPQKPPRPSREMRRASMRRASNPAEETLIEWANSHLPEALHITDPAGPLCGGLGLLRLAESIKGRPSSPPVPDSAFPVDTTDDKLDGLFRLFDFLLDNDVKMGSVSINDVRQGKRDKILQLIRALKAWEDKRRAIAQSIGVSPVQASVFMAPSGMAVAW
ncbi:hypothetical protein BDZ94DRAFT_1226253 [Collybia nuda]|uniref:Polar growth protein n=1 Tax=Collybia nuda TaxID=64659 RepID=A0A9P6CEX7_9AGAR|nr:hypothetical protein BDZ94DRAFT_1226253 [Collybia nuda]